MVYSVYSLETVKLVNNPNPKQILKLKDMEFRNLKKGEVLIKQKYIGINFYDIDISRGIIKKPNGFIPGIEAVGEVMQLGSDIKSSLKVGDKVCYCTYSDGGAYGEYSIVHEDFLISTPDHIRDDMASAVTMRGVFAHTLLRRVFMVDDSSYIMIFNPSGGLGHILTQLAKHYGAYVIAVISKSNGNELYDEVLLKSYGCDLIIGHDDPDFEKKIMVFTTGKGVNVVYDTIGGNNLLKSISVMQYCGLYVSLGQNSGVNLKVSMHKAMEKSIFITRPSLFNYKNLPNDLRLTALEIYDLVRRMVIKPNINKIYKFNELKAVQFYMMNRKASFINIVEV